MDEPRFINNSLKDIWNSITENDKCAAADENSGLKLDPFNFMDLANCRLDDQIQLLNKDFSKSSLYRRDETLHSSSNWDPNFDYKTLQYQSHNINKQNQQPQIYDQSRECFSYPNNNIPGRKQIPEKDSFEFLPLNSSVGINEKLLNKILDNIMMLSKQKDFFTSGNGLSIINNVLQKQLTRQQFQKVQDVVLTIYGNRKNYITDPLQGFYNQELLMLLLKNQNLPNIYNDRKSEPAPRSDMIKPPDMLSENHVSLKDEISILSMSYRNMMGVFENDIEKAATLYRTSATAMAQKNEATYKWTGKLPMAPYKSCQYSRKVFLGGVPWDSTENDLISAFIKFGYLSVMFPQKDLNGSMRYSTSANSLKGYCYIIFEADESVNRLLNQCTRNSANNGDFFKISSPKFRSKDVQVIPWITQDSQYCRLGSQKPDSKKTVFVGALHGMITAYALASVMNELFDNVIFSALDTDKYKYPIGSGRVTFSSQKSYMRAVTANFIHVKTANFSKTIQIDPYLEDSMCNNCFQSPGIYFCRSFECFRYFCSGCWQVWHNRCETLFIHKPLRRTFKPIFDLQ